MMNEETKGEQEILFGNPDLERDVTNNDALVISFTIANFWVKKVFVDSGSLAYIIFYKAFSQMEINNAELTRVNMPLTSFSGSTIEPVGEMMLLISMGSYPMRVTKMVKFLVVDAHSAYNIILGRLNLNSFQAIASTYHLKLKFPSPDGIKEEVGDRRQARECYASSLRKDPNDQYVNPPTKGENPSKEKTPIISEEASIKEGNERELFETKRRKIDEERIEPMEEVKIVVLSQEHGLKNNKNRNSDIERLVDLDLLGEIRYTASTRVEAYKRCMSKAYNA
ncbi:UNVERIFIED_CONTAM: hypothetical protein Slati_3151000 [Sesamum latifolium]|uniref:Uncharacterized protein n=1 Tax=Sesamum latifolium TaxID=2727402 RepID=A0AAW2UVU7_9LAMI